MERHRQTQGEQWTGDTMGRGRHINGRSRFMHSQQSAPRTSSGYTADSARLLQAVDDSPRNIKAMLRECFNLCFTRQPIEMFKETAHSFPDCSDPK